MVSPFLVQFALVASGQVRRPVYLYMVIRIARVCMGRNVGGLSMRGSVRRRNRGSWELTVDLGRHAEGR